MSLPTKSDFQDTDSAYDADTKWAWDNFGGLNISEAYEKFCDKPEIYQEAFMFMGTKAFEYYFEIIEKYILEVKPEDEFDDCSAWIIGCGVLTQIDNAEPEIISRIFSLSNLVIERYSDLLVDENDKSEVIKQWQKVKIASTS